MTIAVGWVRKVNNCEELVFISDSRLCGGHRWDECPKIMTMPCENCVLCFAGDTGYAYPMMMQINYAMGHYNKIRTRAMDLYDLNGYVLKHINHLSQSVYDAANPEEQSENEFIFGGYSWANKEFQLWRYFYDQREHKFISGGKLHSILPWIPGYIAIIGDKRKEYTKELRRILQERYGLQCENYHGSGLDMEPFEALCNILRNVDACDTIGGAPQMVKVYQFMNSRPVGIYWPNKTEDPFQNRTLLGRKMFDFEDSDFWFMDPETFFTHACHKTPTENAHD